MFGHSATSQCWLVSLVAAVVHHSRRWFRLADFALLHSGERGNSRRTEGEWLKWILTRSQRQLNSCVKGQKLFFRPPFCANMIPNLTAPFSVNTSKSTVVLLFLTLTAGTIRAQGTVDAVFGGGSGETLIANLQQDVTIQFTQSWDGDVMNLVLLDTYSPFYPYTGWNAAATGLSLTGLPFGNVPLGTIGTGIPVWPFTGREFLFSFSFSQHTFAPGDTFLIRAGTASTTGATPLAVPNLPGPYALTLCDKWGHPFSAATATVVPEPSVSVLALLGCFVVHFVSTTCRRTPGAELAFSSPGAMRLRGQPAFWYKKKGRRTASAFNTGHLRTECQI